MSVCSNTCLPCRGLETCTTQVEMHTGYSGVSEDNIPHVRSSKSIETGKSNQQGQSMVDSTTRNTSVGVDMQADMIIYWSHTSLHCKCWNGTGAILWRMQKGGMEQECADHEELCQPDVELRAYFLKEFAKCHDMDTMIVDYHTRGDA